MKTVAFTTLGCKVNQYDTDAMKGLFLKGDYEVIPFEEKADIYVVNTCSVTNMGEKKSRQIIRQAQRRNPEAKIVVTGCYAQLNPEAISAIDGVNLVIGTSNRHRVVELVEQLDETEAQINAVRDIMQETTFEEMPLLGTETDKTRATMKIQEGCANYCTFCIIPYTRGRLKSRQLDSIIEEAKRLVAHGFSEVVLTGIHLGNYGVDLKERKNLAEVVRALTVEEGPERRGGFSITFCGRSLMLSIEKLRKILKNEDVYPGAYSFSREDGVWSETVACLRQQPDGQILYYIQDRAEQFNQEYFDTENEACLRVLNTLKYDYPSLNKYL